MRLSRFFYQEVKVDKKLYLTDKQYRRLLLKIKETVDQEDFEYSSDDCTIPGMKETTSNCGLCNDDFTEKDTALFPKDFPERKSMKYPSKNHRCPFDMRVRVDSLGYSIGCFYHCCLFQNVKHRGNKISTEDLRIFVDRTIARS